MTAVQDTLLPGVEWPEPIPEPEPLSPDRRRTRRQRDQIAAGVHPLMGGPLHALAEPSLCSPDSPKGQPFTCGSCRFRQVISYHNSAYPKCLHDLLRADQDAGDMEGRYLSDVAHVSHGPATDVRAWWPACQHYEAGDAGVSADAARMIPRPPDPTPVVLAAVHSDPRASHVAARRVLRVAITECAARHQGRVHIAWFRHLLPEWIDPHAVGGAVAGWTKAGYLVPIPDQWEPNGGGSNATKPTQIRRLVAAIPPIT